MSSRTAIPSLSTVLVVASEPDATCTMYCSGPFGSDGAAAHEIVGDVVTIVPVPDVGAATPSNVTDDWATFDTVFVVKDHTPDGRTVDTPYQVS